MHRTHIYRPEDIQKALAAAEFRTKVVTTRDLDDDQTIRPRPRVVSTAKPFEPATFTGFDDFELDLTCLSTPPSPAPSSCHLPRSPSPQRSPSPPPGLEPLPLQHSLSRTRSFATQALTPLIKPSKKLSTPQLSSKTLPSGSRGSWPGIMRYTGRGTPIDRRRNREWGGVISEEGEVGGNGIGEDGSLLFSGGRSGSLDSHIRGPGRSMSPDWATPSNEEERGTTAIPVVVEPPPALAPINLGASQEDEWESIMQTVLGSAAEEIAEPNSNEATASSTTSHDVAEPNPAAINADPTPLSVLPLDVPMMTPDQIEELHNGLETHLGIHQALDLGLGINITPGVGGFGSNGTKMNLFKLGLLPSSESGRETPSIYSQGETPKPSPPATIQQHDSGHGVRERDGPEKERRAEDASLSFDSTRTGSAGQTGPKGGSGGRPWWRKMLKGMKRLQESIHHRGHRYP
ncbi:hypothetical protein BKA70DRAFT_1388462 [Coprinopsis sp. MPI-PUGE-AT-0042]|nr:hypothetical protein BKA70DRAFT_1388462 [Coprinopsis sp. MPI-PUGE-AT-0042]